MAKTRQVVDSAFRDSLDEIRGEYEITTPTHQSIDWEPHPQHELGREHRIYVQHVGHIVHSDQHVVAQLLIDLRLFLRILDQHD